MARITLNTYNRSETYAFDETYEQVLDILKGTKGIAELHQSGVRVGINPSIVVMVHPGPSVPQETTETAPDPDGQVA